jgi:hypothetical protein
MSLMNCATNPLDGGCELCNYPGMSHLYPLLAERGIRPIELARSLHVDKSTVTRWDENGVPLVRVFQVEKETGIPREKLRPDFFSESAQ